MSKPAHTPGPWSVEHPLNFELSIVEANKAPYEWRFIAAIPLPDKNPDGTQISKRECEANARLIAAAPDMLEALKAVAGLDHIKRNGHVPAVQKLHAAIAKATGAA